MNFDYSAKVQELREELMQFMDEHVYPNEKTFHEQLNAAESRWAVTPIMENLKEKAKAQNPKPLEPLSTRSCRRRPGLGVHSEAIAKLELKKERKGTLLVTEKAKSE